MSTADLDLESILGLPDPEPQPASSSFSSETIPFSIDDLDKDIPLETSSPSDPVDSNSDIEKLRAENARIQSEMHDLRAQFLNRSANEPKAPSATANQPAPAANPANWRDAFNQQFFQDPAAAIQQHVLPAMQMAMAPVQEANAAQFVEQYIDRSQREDPNFQFAEEEFRKIVNDPGTARNLAMMPHQQRAETLKMAKELALGRAYSAAAQRGVSEGKLQIKRPPPYGASLARATPVSANTGWSKQAEQLYAAIIRDNPDAKPEDVRAYFKEMNVR